MVIIFAAPSLINLKVIVLHQLSVEGLGIRPWVNVTQLAVACLEVRSKAD